MAAQPKAVGERQSELNAGTRGQWALFASHRRRIEQLLDSALPQKSPSLLGQAQRLPRLCVLGAGNCNDLDLRLLARRFADIHLIDIDPAALARGIHRQDVAGLNRLHCHAPIDLTGLAPTFDRWLGVEPAASEIGAAIEAAKTAPPPAVPGPFDVVLSSCVLSQLLGPARDRLQVNRHLLPSLGRAIISRHLRMMLQLLSPGGCAVFISDLVSSDTEPALARVPDDSLPELMRSLVQRRRTFAGLDPRAISIVLDELGVDRKWCAPWLWHLSPRRTYLVYAVLMRRKLSAERQIATWSQT
jgi:SAM-dependent methyltransferase